ncbi:uncharacterized protein LOC107641116 [Arachis ipaensis]|uniref:uncharacterized protein LOC107641116 n=1 Tax=Arachis ipaensis TaxID=130454 RepID=UPI0007AFA89A|nr:uncharacterized protein LOC107641116 [Arachis ipaensis]
MAIKLDMSKVYDRVEWRFLWFIMGKLGFGTRWIDWIRELVSTVSYSVIVEGQPFGYFKPEREDNCDNILNLLNSYEGFSGQQINLDKSAVFFSNNTPPPIRALVAGKLNIHHSGAQDKYLGLPSLIHKSKRETFSEIEEKVNGWQRNLLSSGGNQVLLRTVGKTVLVYTLYCFKLLDTLLSEIHSILTNFWWGQRGNERRMAWISWN